MKAKFFWLSAFFSATLFIFFFQLGKNSLIEFDEGIYALVAKRMVDSGELLTLTWRAGVAWFDKGPLYFWLTAPLLKIFGSSAFVIRFWSAFLGWLTVVCVFLIGQALDGIATGLMASAILSSTVGFVYYSRLGMLDAPNAFFNTVSVLFLIYSRGQRRFLYLTAVILGLGFLNRGLLTFLGVLSYLAYVIFVEKVSVRLRREHVLSGVIFVLVAGPWHLIMTWRYGQAFLSTYFWHQMFARFSGTIEGKAAPFFWYVSVVRTQLRIWFVWLISLTPSICYRLFRRDRGVYLLFTWSTLTLVVFSLAQSKLIWYVMPLYPPLALLISLSIGKLLGRFGRLRPTVILLVIALGIFYDWYQWGKIVTTDYNHDLKMVVNEADKHIAYRQLLNVNYGWSVLAFYSQKEVRDVPLLELPALLNENSLAVISVSDLEKIEDRKFPHEEVYRFGEVLLLRKGRLENSAD